MRPGHTAAVVATLAALGIAAWHYAPTSARTTTTAPVSTTTPGAVPSSATQLLQRPQVRAYQTRVDFNERARTFFADEQARPTPARLAQAQALQQELDDYERAGDVSAGEALMLRIGLLRTLETDPVRQADRMAELVAQYRLHADRRNAAFVQAQQHDPAFNDYKAREARVVAEVMAMTDIPGGLERDEYLRQRLQREREIAYASR